MRNFKHLNRTKRIQLESLLRVKTPYKEIAAILGVHLSTIYREVDRGKYEHLNGNTWLYETRYSCDIAEEKYQQNLRDKGRDLKIGNDYKFARYVEKRIIKDKLSPLAVLGEIKRKGLIFDTQICVNTLYSYIEKEVFTHLNINHLPMKGKVKKRKRNIVVKRLSKGTSIEKRPVEINERSTFGHWEMDCVCGSSKATLLVLTERLTRKEIIIPMKNQKCESVIHALNILEHQYGKTFKQIFKTITVDNGREFSDYEKLEKSKYGKSKRTLLYFCHPYCSSERGTNERINREIRRLIPKGTDLSKYTREQIQHVEDWVNDYPRQVLGFATSRELFNIHLNALA